MEKMQALRDLRYWFSRNGLYDPANDGPEVEVFRRERVVRLADFLAACVFKNPRSFIHGGYVDIR